MLTLGRFHYSKPVVLLAPMAGISDLPYRSLCQRFGSHYTIAEMVDARPQFLAMPESQLRLQFDDDARFPKIVQLVGGDPYLMAETAQVMQALGCDVIDINMGCPAKKVGKQNAGSALLSDLPQVEKILAQVTRAVSIPVTLKTRLGFNEQTMTIETVAKIAENTGIAALTVHGRTRAQRFNGTAHYDEIGRIKAQTSLPIIVNGDITTTAQAQDLIQQFGFDGVMIGRAACGNPWLLAHMRCALDCDFAMPAISRRAVISEHISALHQLYQRQGLLIARKHLHWYLAPMPRYDFWRQEINTATDLAAQLAIVAQAVVN